MRYGHAALGVLSCGALIACGAKDDATTKKHDHWVRVLQVLKDSQDNCAANSKTYGDACEAFEAAKHWRGAMHLAQEMQHQSLTPAVQTYNAAIRASTKGEQWEMALMFLSEMELYSKPGTVDYQYLLDCVRKFGKWEHALGMIDVMKKNKIPYSTEGYTAAIQSCREDGRWMEALDFLGQMKKRKVPYSIATYNAAIEACAAGIQFETVEKELLPALKKEKLKTDAATYAAAVEAAGLSGEWVKALHLLETGRKEHGDDVHLEISAIGALAESKEWERGLQLLENVRTNKKFKGTPQEVIERACSHELIGMSKAGNWEQALGLILDMEENNIMADPLSRAKSFAALVENGIEGREVQNIYEKLRRRTLPMPVRPPWRPLGPDLSKIEIVPTKQYGKEIRLLQYVLKHATEGDSANVCKCIEDYGENVLQGQWLKVAGRAKAIILEAAMRGAPPGGMVLEVGAYCGFSSQKIAQALEGVHIATLEVDPIHVAVAKQVIDWGGMSDHIDVWTGHSKDLVPRLPNRYGGEEHLFFSGVFFDQKGSRYDEDLTNIEKLGLLQPGAMVIADNVLKPGAPIFLWHVGVRGDYAAQVVSMREFAMPSEDWMSVSVRRMNAEAKSVMQRAKKKASEAFNKEEIGDTEVKDISDPMNFEHAPPYKSPEVPEDLYQLNRESDRMRDRAVGGSRSVSYTDWSKFADEAKKRMANHGILTTAVATIKL